MSAWISSLCGIALICALTPGIAGAQESATTKGETATHSAAKSKHKAKASLHRSRRKTVRGQQKIDPQRAQQIQQALIREHYLTGQAAGTWNQASEEAMRRYQADHGWQAKTVPDSRALISLGLGPSNDRLLNPESAMTTGPTPDAALTKTSTHASSEARPVKNEPGSSVPPAPAVPAAPVDSPNPQ